MTKPCPLVLYLQLLNPSRDGNSSSPLGSLFQCLTTLSAMKYLPIYNLNLPLGNLRFFSSHPIICYPGKLINTHLDTNFSHVKREKQLTQRSSQREETGEYHSSSTMLKVMGSAVFMHELSHYCGIYYVLSGAAEIPPLSSRMKS